MFKIFTLRLYRIKTPTRLVSHQLNDLDKDPVVGGGGHEFKEQGRQGKVVLGISSGQFTDDVHSS